MTEHLSTPETERGAADAKAALTEFMRDFRGFQGRIETRLKTQEDRVSMLDRKAAARPTLATGAAAQTPEAKAVAAYLRSGDEAGVRALALEGKAMHGAAGADGGFLLDPQTTGRIAGLLRGAGSLRSVAKVVTVQAAAYEVLVDRGEFGVSWVGEASTAAETATTQFERIAIQLHELSAMPRLSQRLLEDSAFDVEAWLAEAIADRFRLAEGAAFVSGDGVNKPKGFLRYPIVSTAPAWGEIGCVATGVSGAFRAGDPANALIDLVYSLGARYRAGAQFLMTSRTASAVRKLKDADGRFLWTEGLGCEQPSRLMGYPVITCEDMPEIGPDAAAIAFGDFHAGYTIVERPELRVLRDPYSVKPHVLFYASLRVGGDVTDFSALRVLKFGAA